MYVRRENKTDSYRTMNSNNIASTNSSNTRSSNLSPVPLNSRRTEFLYLTLRKRNPAA